MPRVAVEANCPAVRRSSELYRVFGNEDLDIFAEASGPAFRGTR